MAGRRLESAQAQRWLKRAERELPNVRAVLGRLRDHGEVTDGLRLAAALGPFWLNAGHITEGGRWLEEFRQLAAYARVDACTRAAALTWSAVLAIQQGVEGAQQEGTVAMIGRLEEALALSREHDDTRGVLRALSWLADTFWLHEDTERAVEFTGAGIALCRASGDRWWLASFLYRAALLAQLRRERPRAAALAQECVATAREAGHAHIAAGGIQVLTQVRLSMQPDRLDLAYAALEEALALGESAGDKRQIAIIMPNLGTIAVDLGDLPCGAR